MFLDIQWYFNNVQLRESNKYQIIVEENETKLIVNDITYDDCGYYTCKLINEIGMTMSRAKFDVTTTAHEEMESDTITTRKSVKGKKKITRKKLLSLSSDISAQDIQTAASTTIIEQEPEDVVETTVEVIKMHRPLTEVIVEQSGVSEVVEVKDRQIADTELYAKSKETTTVIEEEEVEQIIERHITTTVRVKDTITELRHKIVERSVTIEDMIELKQYEEVNILLETIQAESFGDVGEAALRDLATIGLLIRHGCTTMEIIYLYEQNIFFSLKKPESQAALVQLVEREGHDALITEILSESSNEDETTLAATVGFKAFIRMVETSGVTIETVICKFVHDDFMSQDWEMSGKEV